MNEKFITIKNCIPIQFQDEIEQIFTSTEVLPWYLGTETTQEYEKIEVTSIIYHMLYDHRGIGITSEVFHRIKPVVWEICEKAKLPFHEFLQIRAVAQFPIITNRTHNFIHTDIELRNEPYYTAVYYINSDVDGDTIIFDETTDSIPRDSVQEKYKEFTKIANVSPEKGKVTVFPGKRYHASTLPTKKTRYILNFSWF